MKGDLIPLLVVTLAGALAGLVAGGHLASDYHGMEAISGVKCTAANVGQKAGDSKTCQQVYRWVEKSK